MKDTIQDFLRFQRTHNGALTPSLAAKYMGVSRQQMVNLRTRHRLTSVRLNGVHYYAFNDLKTVKGILDARKRDKKKTITEPFKAKDI